MQLMIVKHFLHQYVLILRKKKRYFAINPLGTLSKSQDPQLGQESPILNLNISWHLFSKRFGIKGAKVKINSFSES